MPPVPKVAPGSAKGKPKPKDKARGKAAGNVPSRSLTPAAEAVAAPVILEEVWVQCDACQKWRRLPPGTVVGDDDPWYCSLNPDSAKSNCDAVEESYDADKEVVIASSDPFYSNLVPKDAETLKKELLVKAGYVPDPPAPSPSLPKPVSQLKPPKKATDSGSKKQQGSTGAKSETGSLKGAQSLHDELINLMKACQQLVSNSGSWDVSTPDQPTLVSPPPWVWQHLAAAAPEATQEAAAAVDMVSAARYLPRGGQAPHDPGIDPAAALPASVHDRTEVQGQLDSLARVAIITAAALALSAAEARLGQISSHAKGTAGLPRTPTPGLAAQPPVLASVQQASGAQAMQGVVWTAPGQQQQQEQVQGWPPGHGSSGSQDMQGGGLLTPVQYAQQQPGYQVAGMMQGQSGMQGMALQQGGVGSGGASQAGQMLGGPGMMHQAHNGGLQGPGATPGTSAALQQQLYNLTSQGASPQAQAQPQQSAQAYALNGLNQQNAVMLQYQQLQQMQLNQQQMQQQAGGAGPGLMMMSPVQGGGVQGYNMQQQYPPQMSPNQQQQQLVMQQQLAMQQQIAMQQQQHLMAMLSPRGVQQGGGQPPPWQGGNPS